MSKLILLTGLPGSGKSTKAEELVKKNRNMIRVNKDTLREMLYFLPKDWGPDGKNFRSCIEDFVFNAEKMIAHLALRDGFDVVVDDTNLRPGYVLPFKDMARNVGAEFEIINLDTDVETCIERDSKRQYPVGEKVIRQLMKVRDRIQ